MKKILSLIVMLLISVHSNAQESNWIRISEDSVILPIKEEIGLLRNTVSHIKKEYGQKSYGLIEGVIGGVVTNKGNYFFVPVMMVRMRDEECRRFPLNDDGGLITYLYPNGRLIYKVVPYNFEDGSFEDAVSLYLCHTAYS